MEKLEQAMAVLALVMGLLLIREGISSVSASKQHPRPTPVSLAVVLVGPAGTQRAAQAQFLQQRYGLRLVRAAELTKETLGDPRQGLLVENYPTGKSEAARLATLVRQRSLAAPVIIEIADRHLEAPHLDPESVEVEYPDANIWTLDGTRPVEINSVTLSALLDSTAYPKPD